MWDGIGLVESFEFRSLDRVSYGNHWVEDLVEKVGIGFLGFRVLL